MIGLREQLIEAGMKDEEISNYYSDLYVLKNEISTEFIKNMDPKPIVREFRNKLDNKIWYDIAFGYLDEYIENKKGV